VRDGVIGHMPRSTASRTGSGRTRGSHREAEEDHERNSGSRGDPPTDWKSITFAVRPGRARSAGRRPSRPKAGSGRSP
jgi:hypothetical protein